MLFLKVDKEMKMKNRDNFSAILPIIEEIPNCFNMLFVGEKCSFLKFSRKIAMEYTNGVVHHKTFSQNYLNDDNLVVITIDNAEDCNLVQWENFLTQLDNEKSNKRKLFVFAEVDIINRFPELTRRFKHKFFIKG